MNSIDHSVGDFISGNHTTNDDLGESEEHISKISGYPSHNHSESGIGLHGRVGLSVNQSSSSNSLNKNQRLN